MDVINTVMETFFSEGVMGAMLAYFVYKDNVTTKELRATMEENTRTTAEFTAMLDVIKDIIRGSVTHE